MCNNCQYKGIMISLPPNLAAENEELKKQVAVLSEALDRQLRENQPYIKALESKAEIYRGMLRHAKDLLERTMAFPIPDDAVTSDIFHFRWNELEDLFPTPAEPLTP